MIEKDCRKHSEVLKAGSKTANSILMKQTGKRLFLFVHHDALECKQTSCKQKEVGGGCQASPATHPTATFPTNSLCKRLKESGLLANTPLLPCPRWSCCCSAQWGGGNVAHPNEKLKEEKILFGEEAAFWGEEEGEKKIISKEILF